IGNGQLRAELPLQPLFLIVTPALCGLLTCLSAQRQQTFQFLAERGVSPARMWWVKQCVWLSSALLLVLAFLRWGSIAPQLLMLEQPQVTVLARGLAHI